MKVMIAGGTGFIGSALIKSFQADGYFVSILRRSQPAHPNEYQWDGQTLNAWSEQLSETDIVINATGYGLEHWPWTQLRKKQFLDSRVNPGKTLVEAIKLSSPRPTVFIQLSGINYYGFRRGTVADETTSASDDYLSKLTVKWEFVTNPLEELGLRRIIARCAVVLDDRKGMLPLMALPVRVFCGGPIGDGQQAIPWIHRIDLVEALLFLLKSENLYGVFNLVAPTPTSNEEFMKAVANALNRPYWFRTPAPVLRAVLGEMSTLIVEGRYSRPRRLLDAGYRFRFPNVEDALMDLFRGSR